MRYNEIHFTKANASMYPHVYYTRTKCEKDGYHNHILQTYPFYCHGQYLDSDVLALSVYI